MHFSSILSCWSTSRTTNGAGYTETTTATDGLPQALGRAVGIGLDCTNSRQLITRARQSGTPDANVTRLPTRQKIIGPS